MVVAAGPMALVVADAIADVAVAALIAAARLLAGLPTRIATERGRAT